MEPTGYLLDLPVIAYRRAHDLQLSIVKARHCGRIDSDAVVMLEHAPVFTLGRRGGMENLLVSKAYLEARSIQLVPVERGGDITYHGPGQLVVYVLMDINGRRMGVSDFVTRLENAMVKTAAHWGVAATGDTANRGAWVDGRKLGSIGITVRRGITFHGLALNVSTDLEPFQWINPCGIKTCSMTTLVREAGNAIEMAMVRRQMALHLSDLLDMGLTRMSLDDMEARLKMDL